MKEDALSFANNYIQYMSCIMANTVFCVLGRPRGYDQS